MVDWEYLAPYEEVALRRKIYPFIPPAVVEKIKQENTENLALLKKSVAHFTLPLAVPMLKVTLTNAGVSQLKDQELLRSHWWDVRDMALHSIQIAEDALSDLVDRLLGSPLAQEMEFPSVFKHLLFRSATDFFSRVQLRGGYEVFTKLIPSMEYAMNAIIRRSFAPCVFENLALHPELSQFLKNALAFFTLADAFGGNLFVFTSSGIFIQWEQLPWQKSALLSPTQLSMMQQSFNQKGKMMLRLAQQYIEANIHQFPCMVGFNRVERQIYQRKSGLYF